MAAASTPLTKVMSPEHAAINAAATAAATAQGYAFLPLTPEPHKPSVSSAVTTRPSRVSISSITWSVPIGQRRSSSVSSASSVDSAEPRKQRFLRLSGCKPGESEWTVVEVENE